MSKNLEVDRFRNGDSIPQAKSEADWVLAKVNQKPIWCYYAFDESNGRKYGKLYNWFAVSDSRGLAPRGYHVASSLEWDSLATFLGGWNKAGMKLKSTTGWKNDGNGDNSSGFNGLPGGDCNWKGDFEDMTQAGQFWSSSEWRSDYAWYCYLYYDHSGVGRDHPSKLSCFSVRCIKE